MIVLFIAYGAKAQDNSEPFETGIQAYHERWNNLIPRYTKMQYAGSMGLVSVGVGWVHGKKEHWETDLIVGYIPKYTTDRAKACITIKENYIPWKLQTKNQNLYIDPFHCGLYFNTILDKEFWGKESSEDSNSIYNYSTKVRLNIYIGQRITYKINPDKRQHLKSVSAFYEISSNDLYIISAFDNKYLRPTDYLHLSFGFKMQWR